MPEGRVAIEEWSPGHRRWQELEAVIAAEGQADWAFGRFSSSYPRHFLIALQDGRVVGFLMFVVWEIGPHDRDHPVLRLNGAPLTEAKVNAFGVVPAHRRQGVGRALQLHAIERARELGCHQVRSVSSAKHPENQQLKLSLGFGVEPLERDEPAMAFVMPLRRH